jgi:hypothetical protein
VMSGVRPCDDSVRVGASTAVRLGLGRHRLRARVPTRYEACAGDGERARRGGMDALATRQTLPAALRRGGRSRRLSLRSRSLSSASSAAS